jgi:outer membrane lipoprotein-sorting protein
MTGRKKANRLARCLDQMEACSEATQFLDRETVGLMETAKALSSTERPDPSFVRVLREELLRAHPSAHGNAAKVAYGDEHEISGMKGKTVPSHKKRTWDWIRQVSWAAAVVLLVLAELGIFFQTVPDADAQQVVERMKQSAASIRVGSYRATVDYWGTGKDGKSYRSVSKRWYQAPGRFRQETTHTLPRPFTRTVVVKDGTFWSSNSGKTQVRIDGASADTVTRLAGPFLGAEQLEDILQSSAASYEARLSGSGLVAGRPAYVLELDVRESRDVARMRVWVDMETYFALRVEAYDARGRLRFRQETREIVYNAAMDDTVFRFGDSGSAPFGQEDVSEAAPVRIRFSSNQSGYRRGETAAFRVILENVGNQPIRLNGRPRLVAGFLKEEQTVWEQELEVLSGKIIRPGEAVQAIAWWRVDAPPGKYMVILRGLEFSATGAPQPEEIGLGLLFVQ